MKRLTPEEFSIAERTPAQDRLYRIVNALFRGNPLDPAESRFLAESLLNILLGDDPKKVLGISGRQASGRPKKSYLQIDRSEVRPVVEAMELMRFQGQPFQGGPDSRRPGLSSLGLCMDSVTWSRWWTRAAVLARLSPLTNGGRVQRGAG